jgi:hypothetical protein
MPERDAALERRPIPEAMVRTPLFAGLPQHYLVVWLAALASASIAVGNGLHPVLGGAVFVAGAALVHPRLARACEEDDLALDVFFHWVFHERTHAEPHPSIWDRPDRVRPSIPRA